MEWAEAAQLQTLDSGIMGVGLHTQAKSYELGAASFFTSWFSTICVRLEKGSWGGRFPAIMNELYAGSLPADHIPEAMRELRIIQNEFGGFGADAIVWDHDDRTKQPPWGKNIAREVTSLANYFVTSDGKDLFLVIRNAFEEALRSGHAVTVQ
jgi:2,3-bisphosphoglycerate-dependent phosphoglycerate mutase